VDEERIRAAVLVVEGELQMGEPPQCARTRRGQAHCERFGCWLSIALQAVREGSTCAFCAH